MARKAKRKPARRQGRPLPAASLPAQGPARSAASPTRGGGEQAVRAIEMSLAPRGAVRGRPGRIVLDAGDPGIPYDRVPYFRSDLVKLGAVAAVMLVLLFLGHLLIPLVVK